MASVVLSDEHHTDVAEYYQQVATPRNGEKPKLHDIDGDGVIPRSISETAPVTRPTPSTKIKSPKNGKVAAKESSQRPGEGARGEEQDPAATFRLRDLYRYATRGDIVLLVLGLVMTVINGALFPCMALIFGEVISSFQPYDEAAVNHAALLYLGIAIILFITDYVSYVMFFTTAERQMKALRQQGFAHMLHLDISWYDGHDALQLASRLTGDTVKIREGMGQKLGDSLRFTAQFIAGYIIGFVKGWDISLVMACVMPCIAFSLAWMLKTLRARTEWAQKVYAEAGAVAEETLGSMRTVVSNNGEMRAIAKYNAKAKQAEQENIALAKLMAIVIGVFFCSMWLMYAAGLWYGGKRVADNHTTPGNVFSAFFGILIGSMAMAQISPNITAVAQAKGAAAGLYQILGTVSKIDASRDDHGVIPKDGCAGHIQAIGVHFAYPSRPEAQILNEYNVTIGSGQTVAFVGASGGGKSTLIALLERFYDPQRGQILLDGRDITTLNVKWLRSQIGLVSQEPVLFATTIHENIAFGASSSDGSEITRAQVEAAAKLANAHEFIMKLPNNYDTLVGEKGLSLSGGQKQRIAIARAIVREPKILVLDEATSALDAESERVVQAALNELMAKTQMTTLVIAHRLSTIRHADKIVVVTRGTVVEEGPHAQLMAIKGGVYRNLYTIQTTSGNLKDDERELEEARASLLSASTTTFVTRQHSSASSISDVGDNNTALSSKTNELASFSVFKALALCRPERNFFLVGCLGAAVVGCSMPGSAVLISGMVSSMTEKYMKFQQTHDRKYLDDLYNQVQVYGALYVGGAGVLLIATAVQQFCFKYMAEKLTSRLRDMNFSALCRQSIGFFDETRHATGALTADLATNATQVALLSGDAQGRVVQSIFTFVAAMLISFLLGSWLLTLVMLAVFPLLIFGQVVRVQQIKGGVQGGSDDLADSGAHASQALGNIRTIVSLGLEAPMIKTYGHLLEAPLKHGLRQANVNGLALGFSSFIVFAVYSLVFWYGGKLVHRDEITFDQLIRTLMAIMMSAQGIGSAASWLADADNAQCAGATIFTLVEATVPIDAFAEDGLKLERVQGKLEFQNVYFKYPTRTEVTVLKRYNLTIEAGETVAFCGPSGGGKSTVISLIERFYDPVKGHILLDGHDLKDLNLRWLRSQIGLVGQEPTLFIGTIAENIAYGLSEMPSHDEIVNAARMANADQFITNFPDGYDTQVGMKGEKLSGGQKQRIAIARAILKNPSMLLLDEATSALDSESEKVVQVALDKIVSLQRRTTIIIAHRLSTIRKADKICVVSGGNIAEQGTHSELLALNGMYARLVAKTHE
ncbi:Multidrug resistance protein abc superfamily, partial [Globisporangium splendens]